MYIPVSSVVPFRLQQLFVFFFPAKIRRRLQVPSKEATEVSQSLVRNKNPSQQIFFVSSARQNLDELVMSVDVKNVGSDCGNGRRQQYIITAEALAIHCMYVYNLQQSTCLYVLQSLPSSVDKSANSSVMQRTLPGCLTECPRSQILTSRVVVAAVVVWLQFGEGSHNVQSSPHILASPACCLLYDLHRGCRLKSSP